MKLLTPSKTPLTLSQCFEHTGNGEVMLARVFSWLTRCGAGRKFGSLPIGWYQSHQCHCIDILKEQGADVVRSKLGNVQTLRDGKWQTVISTIELFQQADNRTRK